MRTLAFRPTVLIAPTGVGGEAPIPAADRGWGRNLLALAVVDAVGSGVLLLPHLLSSGPLAGGVSCLVGLGLTVAMDGYLRGAGGPRGSALRASREDKGQNSYYYAHDTPTVAGSSPAPQLLSRAASTDSSPGQLEAVPIERYSFLDEGKKVKMSTKIGSSKRCRTAPC